MDYPEKIENIEVGKFVNKMHFLHTSAWHDQEGEEIGQYIVSYSDGVRAIIPIIYQKDVVDWWFMEGDKQPSEAAIAWQGQNQRTKEYGYSLGVYKSTWSNPHPENKITKIDFVSTMAESGPILFAVTVE